MSIGNQQLDDISAPFPSSVHETGEESGAANMGRSAAFLQHRTLASLCTIPGAVLITK